MAIVEVAIRKEIHDDLTAVAEFLWMRQKYSKEAVAAGNDAIKEIKRQIAVKESWQ